MSVLPKRVLCDSALRVESFLLKLRSRADPWTSRLTLKAALIKEVLLRTNVGRGLRDKLHRLDHSVCKQKKESWLMKSQ